MKKLIIKIERELLQITQVERTPKELLISMSSSFDLPDYLKKDPQNRPDVLSDFINICLENGQYHIRDIVLLFDNNLGFFKEYKFKKSNKITQDKMFHIEDDMMLNSKVGRNISQRLDYNIQIEENPMDKGAIYGIDDGFLRELVKELKKNNIHAVYATSSLILYMKSVTQTIDIIKDDLDEYEKIIALDINSDSFRSAVVYRNKDKGFGIEHLEEFNLPKSAGPEDENMTDVLTDLLKNYSTEDDEKTYVIISGTVDTEAESKRLMSYSGITCKSIMTHYEKIRDTFELVEDLDNSDQSFPEIFSICGIDIKKDKDESYLYGGWSRRRFSKATSKLAIVAAVLVAILFSMLPIYNVYMINKNKEYTAEIEKSKYTNSLALLTEYRDTLSTLKAYQDDEAAIDSKSQKYSDVLSKLRKDLLADAVINDLFCDEESGLIIDFDVTNVKAYEKARDKLNEERELIIVETSAVDSEGGQGKNYQIKVTVNQ